jgi:hypothetical protein
MPIRLPRRRYLLALTFSLGFSGSVVAADYASAISAWFAGREAGWPPRRGRVTAGPCDGLKRRVSD